mmetsp:Transcript_6319/g.39387  ORF Transcript_6319/g.39387 Transcript_6319/m.39387 type:complete len:696 (-) Transcript_6319:320-2407(-)
MDARVRRRGDVCEAMRVRKDASLRGRRDASRRCRGKRSAGMRLFASGDASLVWLDGLTKRHDGERALFQDVTCTVARGDKVAVIGANGSGKTTLLKLVANEDAPDQGKVQWRRGLRVGYLSQEPMLAAEHTVLDAVVKADTPVGQAVRQYEDALVWSAKQAPGSMKALEQAMTKMDSLDGWELYAEAKRVLDGLGCQELDQRVGELSGGMRRRVALAAALLAQPDLLVLDEPTNHMDLETVRWLEQKLGTPNLSVMLVTHDRYFMEATCNRILELEGGTAYMHNFGGKGSYERFLDARKERRKQIEADAARAKNKLRKETEWMRRMPKARQTKSRARIDRYYKLSERASRRASKDLSIQLDRAMTRQGTKVVLMENACLEIGGKQVLDNFTYEFGKGERWGVVGPNGVGKSTFLNAIAGEMALDAGTRDVGDTITVGYYKQDPPEVPEGLKLLDYVKEFAEASTKLSPEGNLARPDFMLERLGFPRKRHMQLCGSLSGGERRRLHLATVLLKQPNFLILDEPTNDLDLHTIEALEEYLENFEGTLLVVSHDRRFLDNVVDRLFVLEGGEEVYVYDGMLSEYLEDQEQQKKADQAQQKQAKTSQEPAKPAESNVAPLSTLKKLSFGEEKELKRLEEEMESLNLEKAKLEAALAEHSSGTQDVGTITELSNDLSRLLTVLDQKTDRWLELAERAELS